MSHLSRTLIAGLTAFQGLSDDDLDEILSLGRSAFYARDTVVFAEGGDAYSFYLLLDGHIRVVRTTPNGGKIIVRYINEGELYGIAAALGRNTYPATAEAASDCVSIVWPNSAWQSLSEKFPAFRVGTYKTVAARLEDTQVRLAELSTERVQQRVASALIRLADQSGRKVADGIEVEFPISREDIAELTGTTLHTVSRLLSRWEELGWLTGGRQRIVVRDRTALAEIARDGDTG